MLGNECLYALGDQLKKRNRRLRRHGRLLPGGRRRAEERHAGFFHDREDSNVVDVPVGVHIAPAGGYVHQQFGGTGFRGGGLFRGLFRGVFAVLFVALHGLTLLPCCFEEAIRTNPQGTANESADDDSGARNIFGS